MARLHKRYGKRRKRSGPQAPRPNPPLMEDLVNWVAPGFAGFAAARFVTRIATTQVSKWKPGLGKHAGALAAAGSFVAAWYLGGRVKATSAYHTPITVGAAIAGIQSLVQLYVPMLGWMVSDATPELAAATSTAALTPDAASLAVANLDLKPVDDDPNEFVYTDAFDPGRYGPPASSGGPASPNDDTGTDVSDLQIDDAIGQNQNLGVFTN